MTEQVQNSNPEADNDGALDFILYGPSDRNFLGTALHLAAPFAVGVLTGPAVRGWVSDKLAPKQKEPAKPQPAVVRDITPAPATLVYKE